jgi:hypothetical protein
MANGIRIAAGIAAAGAAAALLSACGSGSPAASRQRTPTTVTVTVTSSGTSSTTGTGSATTTTTTAAAGACTASTLTPRFVGSNGATGNVVLNFTLTNSGSSACHTYGWPGVAFTGAGGALLPTHVERTSEDLLGSTPAQGLTIQPGQEVSFRMVAPDQNSAGGTSGCVAANGVQIIAPNDTATMHVTIGSALTECGRASVSPLLSGGSAAPGV